MGVIKPRRLYSSEDTLNVNLNEDMTDEIDCGCTCNGHKLFASLVRFAKPSVFVAVLIAFAIVLGAVQGFFNIHYQKNSINASFSLVEWLLVGSQVVQAVVVVPLTYAGGRRHRPVWLAFIGGALFVSCVLYGALLLEQNSDYQVSTTYSLKQDPTLCVKYSERIVANRKNEDWLTLSSIYLLHFCLGLASVSLFAFAITYVDDNVDTVNSPGIIGIVLGLQQLGPLLGTTLAWMCGSTLVTAIIWIVLGLLMMVVSVMIGLFPRSLLDSGGGPAVASVYYTKSKGYFGSLLRVLTNRIFLLITLGLSLVYTATWSFSLLLTRYEESVYYASSANGFDDPWITRQIVTFVRPLAVGAVMLVSGVIMFRCEPLAPRITLWATVALFLTAAIFFANIFLTCSNVRLTTESKNRLDLTMYCNKDCQCGEGLPFSPVYARQARLVYYSPCHAGCTTVSYQGEDKVYKNCSCVPTESVMSGVYDQSTCQVYGIVFELLTVLSAVLVGSTVVGLLMLSFRVVLNCDKPLMIALQLSLVSLLATIPGRQLFLLVARWSCIISGTDQCRLHEAQPFVTYINLTTILFLLLAVGVFVVLSFLVRTVVLYEDVDRAPRKTSNAAITEMREMRVRSSNGRDRRHSFHGEDQRLLGASGPTVTIQRAPSTGGLPPAAPPSLSTYEGQVQKAASYSEELNKLLQEPEPEQTTPAHGNSLNVPSHGITIRREGMLTTLL